MRIHTNTITARDLRRAVAIASAGGHGVVSLQNGSPTQHGSRSHREAWNVKLEGDGSVQRRRCNLGWSGDGQAPYAASYDAWGWFLGHLFIIDPTMHAGPYKGADDFHAQTHGAYDLDAMLEVQRREIATAAA